MKRLFFLSLFACLAFAVNGQVKLQKRYQPASDSKTPVTYSAESPKPVTYNTTTNTDEESRRAAALAKIQGRPSTTTAKGLSPVTYSTDGVAPVAYSAPDPATTVTVNGENVQRTVRKGRGQVGDDIFTPVSELYYVQFAVYCKDTPVDKAPPIEGLYLLWHPGSSCPGGAQGASYIVKGYNNPEEARAAVASFKANNIDCWFNPALTGAEVEIIGVR
ncbi:MAG: hypothetical protein EP344_02015 [Bacteroidetes bacterium]|nr:MAG: hypothetical protein EP344_02015 [Bacteroidota bacterium]